MPKQHDQKAVLELCADAIKIPLCSMRKIWSTIRGICPDAQETMLRCIPYPKVEFGIRFELWQIAAFGGYMISAFIMIVGIILWSIALAIRLKQQGLETIEGIYQQ